MHAYFTRHVHWKSLLLDLLVVLGLCAFTWFVIGYYTSSEYLATGYQDWIYHAYRIKAIGDYGLSSWDHIWSNGLNIWKAYQYVPHLITLFFQHLFRTSPTKGMLITTVVVMMGYVVTTYLFTRLLGAKRLASVVAILSSLTAVAVWGIIKDYSIFFVLLFFPLFIYLWALDIKRQRASYLVPTLAGLFWVIHPTLGYSAAGLWLFTFTPRLSKENLTFIGKRALCYMATFSMFLIPYLTRGYNYSNPSLFSPQFLRATLSENYLGFGLLLLSLGAFAWLFVFLRTSLVPRWARLLIVYCSLFVVLMLLGRDGFLPKVIVQLQISRAIPIVIIGLTFVLSTMFTSILSIRSRFLAVIAYAFTAIVVAQIIEVSSSNQAVVVNTITEPVSQYFDQKETPYGNVFIDNVSEASYFSKKGIRFVTSYNTHLEPHPLAQRFNLLLKNDVSYTGITKKQSDLVSAYSTVLGVEYLFLPKLSPVIANITASESGRLASFTLVDDYQASESGAAVLRSTRPIAYAYEIPEGVTINETLLRQPTLNASSWSAWDQEVTTLASLIQTGTLKPLPLSFVFPDRLEIDIREKKTPSRRILVTQSQESHWKSSLPGTVITPTTLRHMIITLPEQTSEQTLILQHNWPIWHWPLQLAGFLFTGIVVVLTIGWSHLPERLRRKLGSRIPV